MTSSDARWLVIPPASGLAQYLRNFWGQSVHETVAEFRVLPRGVLECLLGNSVRKTVSYLLILNEFELPSHSKKKIQIADV